MGWLVSTVTPLASDSLNSSELFPGAVTAKINQPSNSLTSPVDSLSQLKLLFQVFEAIWLQ